MKKINLLLVGALFGFLLISCTPSNKTSVVNDGQAPASEKILTNEEKEAARTADMIKAIEEEDIRMKAAGETN